MKIKSILVGFGLFIASFNVFAVTMTPTAKIILLITNWNEDRMLVTIAAPTINPDNCPANDAYATADGVANHSQQALLLTALNANLPVGFAIQGCLAGRPAIIGVYGYPN